MPAYPLPARGISRGSKPYLIDNLQTTRLGDNSLYGVANGSVKVGYILVHAKCTWAEWLAILSSYSTNRALAAGTITFKWPSDGLTKTTRWVSPPEVEPIGGVFYRVTAKLEE
jgi:hypothetical protein